jgi:hypothetical protein
MRGNAWNLFDTVETAVLLCCELRHEEKYRRSGRQAADRENVQMIEKRA